MNRHTLLIISLILPFMAFGQKLKFKEKRSLKRLKVHVEYLASDRLEGRGTGSQGELESANYLSSEFEKLGLIPKGDNGTYIQKFELTTLRMTDTKNTSLAINEDIQRLNSDFYPISYSSNSAKVKAEVVDCGFGIKNEKRNDYEGKDLKGKVAMINYGSPDGIHPHSAFVAFHGVQIRVDLAQAEGAIGVIFYTTDSKVEVPSGEMEARMKPAAIPVVFMKNEQMLLAHERAEVELKVEIITDGDAGHNVVAFIDNGAEHTVVIGAHHDHLGRGEHGNSLSKESGEIHNGADDNASGTAALLELARKLRKKRKWNKLNNYLFIAFSAEELGLVGSKYYLEHPTLEIEKFNYMLNMDMIGMLDSNNKVLVINGVGTSPVWNEAISALNDDLRGISSIKTTSSGIGASDHSSFYLKGVPAIHFFTGQHAYYHKPTDDVENLNFGGQVHVVCYMLDMVKELNDQGKIEYSKTKQEDSGSRTRFKVTLGVIPDYIYDGEGMRIDGVKEGKPAQVAGIRDGDIVISLNGTSIKNMMDYMKVLGSLNPGDKAKCQVLREGKIIDLNVQF